MKSETKIPFFLINRFLLRGNRWKLMLIVFLMAAAFINLVFVTSLFNGIIEMTNDQIINTYTGNIMIAPKSGDDFIENTDQTVNTILKTPGVEAASPQISIPGSLEFNNIKNTWPILAINPELEKKVTNVKDKIIEGEYLEESDEDAIIIGRQIAGGEGVEMDAFSLKGARVGDKVELEYGGYSKEYTIKGIFYTKFMDTDKRAFITIASANEQFPDLFAGKATNIIIKTTESNIEERVIDEIKKSGLEGRYYSWKDVAGLMKTVTESFSSINLLLTMVGILIAAFTIFIVIYIDVSGKKQQIGILRAIGIKAYLINALYLMQSVVYSCFGVLLGAIIYFGVLIPYFNHYPFALPIGDAKLVTNYADLIIRTEIIIFVAMAAGLIPTIIITRMKLLNAIWGR